MCVGVWGGSYVIIYFCENYESVMINETSKYLYFKYSLATNKEQETIIELRVSNPRSITIYNQYHNILSNNLLCHEFNILILKYHVSKYLFVLRMNTMAVMACNTLAHTTSCLCVNNHL